MNSDPNSKSGIITIPSESASAVAERERTAGAQVYTLPDQILGKEGFFRAVNRTFPLDPPLVGPRLVWDALSDSMFGGLLNLGAGRIVSIWPNTAAMEAAFPTDYEVALSVLRQIIQHLKNPSTTAGRPKEVMVYLA